MKRKREFYFEGRSFIGELLEDKFSYRIWQELNSKEKFITTGFPSEDQLIVFNKFGEEFVFFERFKDKEGVWQLGSEKLVSHYYPLLPYQSKALVVPYKIEGEGHPDVLVEFFDAILVENIWKFQQKDGDPWLYSNFD